MALDRGLPADLPKWQSSRDQIYHQIMARGWHQERQAFVQHYDTEFLDAAVLLMPLVNFVAPTDKRWLSTLDAMSRELVSDSLVYRYNVEASPDGLEGEEGTFSICTFWYVEALARVGPRGRGAAGVREDAHLREPPRPLLGADRADRGGARQLPPGVHAPGADQRRVLPGPRAGLALPLGSIRVTLSLALLLTHSEPAPAAMPTGAVADPDRRPDHPGRSSGRCGSRRCCARSTTQR